MRVLLSGSHGLIGSHLLDRLTEEGDEVVRLVRTAASQSEVRWDPMRGPVDIKELELFDAVINLGGKSIGEKRWSEKEKERLWDSRVLPTEVLANAILQPINRPKVFLSASAVGFYGDQGDTELTEDSPRGEGFLATLCEEWEKSTKVAEEAGVRVAHLRSGVVFSAEGGTLGKQLPLYKLGLAGRLGSGKQWMSWIDIEDEVRAIIHVLRTDSISGPVNLVSPESITNAQFTDLLGTVLRRPTFIPAPRWMIAAALGGQITDELLLASQRAVPAKLLDNGFEFSHANPADSLVGLFAPSDLHLLEDDNEDIDLGPRPIVAEQPQPKPLAKPTEGNGKHSKDDDSAN